MSNSIQSYDTLFKTEPIHMHATIYRPANNAIKAVILYFHGGGLLYGNRKDLPETHIQILCNHGYAIISFDYRLAPASTIESIFEDVNDAIEWYLAARENLFSQLLPYFLWGRSAGAYLALLNGIRPRPEMPQGIISFYGYGFLTNHWFDTPNPHYTALPEVHISTLSDDAKSPEHCTGKLETHFNRYVYARQTGQWSQLFYSGRAKNFFLIYSLRKLRNDSQDLPLFLAHSVHDPDVPYQESQELCKLFPSNCFFISHAKQHDFDRNSTQPETKRLMTEVVDFLHKNCYDSVGSLHMIK